MRADEGTCHKMPRIFLRDELSGRCLAGCGTGIENWRFNYVRESSRMASAQSRGIHGRIAYGPVAQSDNVDSVPKSSKSRLGSALGKSARLAAEVKVRARRRGCMHRRRPTRMPKMCRNRPTSADNNCQLLTNLTRTCLSRRMLAP